MAIFLDAKRWREVFEGFNIVDVAIREWNILQFCSREKVSNEELSLMWDHDRPTRIVSLFLDRPSGNNCGYQELTGMANPVLGVSRSPFPCPSGMVSAKNMDGDTWPVGGGHNGPMEHIAKGQKPFPERLKCINGYTYAVCANRKIYKRENRGKWVLITDIPEIKGYSGFLDMDAFSENDMYAVGGCGDMWRFDGTKWKEQVFPTNEQLGTVTCAPDGNVYVSSEGGSLWVGKGDSWKRVYQGGSSILWNDVLWFDGKLWLASDYQLRVWDGGNELKTVEENGKPVPAYGHMDVHDGLLAIASPEFVMTFDGKQWRSIVAPYLD